MRKTTLIPGLALALIGLMALAACESEAPNYNDTDVHATDAGSKDNTVDQCPRTDGQPCR